MVRIVEINIEWISENSFRFVKWNLVLRQISFGFVFIPLEFHGQYPVFKYS